MKIVKTFFVCLLLFISKDIFSQNIAHKLLMIEIQQSSSYANNKIVVTENDLKLEEILLSTYNYKHIDSNQVKINKALLRYTELGYKLISSVRGNIVTQTNDTVMVTTYLFEKE